MVPKNIDIMPKLATKMVPKMAILWLIVHFPIERGNDTHNCQKWQSCDCAFPYRERNVKSCQRWQSCVPCRKIGTSKVAKNCKFGWTKSCQNWHLNIPVSYCISIIAIFSKISVLCSICFIYVKQIKMQRTLTESYFIASYKTPKWYRCWKVLAAWWDIAHS